MSPGTAWPVPDPDELQPGRSMLVDRDIEDRITSLAAEEEDAFTRARALIERRLTAAGMRAEDLAYPPTTTPRGYAKSTTIDFGMPDIPNGFQQIGLTEAAALTGMTFGRIQRAIRRDGSGIERIGWDRDNPRDETRWLVRVGDVLAWAHRTKDQV